LDIQIALSYDVEEILALQKLAFLSEAELYDDYTIAPLTQTLDAAREDFIKHKVLKAVIDGKIIGSVKCVERDGTCHIVKLIVHPEYQNRGVGTALMREIERLHPQAKRFELFTGWKSVKNIHLYEKLGYKTFETKVISDKLKFVFMRKN
jgi:ribosomal protein S18 acetylase RimI-like enzyme